VGQLDADHRDQALPDVLALEVAVLEAFRQVAGAHVLVDGPGEPGLEAGEMRAAFPGVDVVGKGENLLVIGVIILTGDLHLDAALGPEEINGVRVDGGLVAVEVLDEGDDAAFVDKFVLAARELVQQIDAHPAVEEGELPETPRQEVVTEVNLGKNLAIGKKGHLGAPALGLAGDGQGRGGLAPFVALVIDLAVPADLHLEIFGQGIDHRDAHAVEAAGDLVGAGIELAAGVQAGHNHLHRGQVFAGVQVHWNAPAVVLHRDAVVRMNGNLDFVAMPAHGLVDGVVHHLVDQVVEAFGAGIADIHGRPFPHGLQAFEDLNFISVVLPFTRKFRGTAGYNR